MHVRLETVQTSDGPVLLLHIPPRPRGTVFHTHDGKYLTRLGEGLRGMTPAEIDAIRREVGSELTAEPVPHPLERLRSPSALEELRNLMRETGAAADLLRLPDCDLLSALGVLDDEGRLLTAGLLLVGKPDAIRNLLPHASWQYRRMKSDTEYDQPHDGFDCIPVALRRLRELVAANNPVVTIPGWLVHPEFPRYPALALRELIVNALVHRDYEAPGSVVLKIYPNRLEVSNPGGFIGGVTPENILHHPSVPRYPTLFQALTRLRLANAANLGVPRVYRDLLSEGKEPPIYWATNQLVRVTVKAQEARPGFLEFVKRYPDVDVDHLLVVHYLTRHRELTAQTAAQICQRSIKEAQELLSELAHRWQILDTGGGAGRGRYYRLSRNAYTVLVTALSYHVDRQLLVENAKARVLSALANAPLSNQDIREITQMNRAQAVRLMKSLERERKARIEGTKRGAKWVLVRGETGSKDLS